MRGIPPSFIGALTANPKAMFLVDSVGACLSAILLFAMANYYAVFGMPQIILYLLASIAFTFAIYSFCCYYFVLNRWRPYLMVITVANFSYSLLTMCLIICYYQSLTWMGIAYFVAELVALYAIILLEVRTLQQQ